MSILQGPIVVVQLSPVSVCVHPSDHLPDHRKFATLSPMRLPSPVKESTSHHITSHHITLHQITSSLYIKTQHITMHHCTAPHHITHHHDHQHHYLLIMANHLHHTNDTYNY